MSSTNAHTPADLTITPRDLRLKETADASRWWHGGDPVATAFFNALSASFPLGERFFIDSVKRFRNVADPRLQTQIDAFVVQESIHSREHVAFNDLAEDNGYDLGAIDAFLKRRFKWARSRPTIQQLAATTALEHFTAILAHEALDNPKHLDGVPASIQKLWRWHAIEEIEHKAVAFDTLMAATQDMSNFGRWFFRCHTMVFATFLFLHEIFFSAGEFFRQDGMSTPRTWLRFLHYICVRPGLLRRVLGSYFAYYRPGFHPWHVDDRALIRSYEPALVG